VAPIAPRTSRIGRTKVDAGQRGRTPAPRDTNQALVSA
jgi:hypothetical protein